MRTNIATNNPFQDATQPAQFPNASSVNLPNVDELSVGDLNKAILQPNPSAGPDRVDTESEPLFGTHLREAAATVKKLLAT